MVGAPKFLPKFIGPYRVTKVISRTAYELNLPDTMKVHPVFHVHLLKPYHDPHAAFPSRIRDPTPEPEFVDDNEPHWEVESILKKRRRGRQVEYLVKWKDFPPEEATWEPLENMVNADQSIQEYEERNTLRQRRRGPRSVSEVDESNLQQQPSTRSSPRRRRV
jgi:hypothetical protein